MDPPRRRCRFHGGGAAAAWSPLMVALLVLPQLSSAAFEPATRILLNCGSRDSATPPNDNRPFLPDSTANSVSSPAAPSRSSIRIAALRRCALYQTARVATGRMSYEFSVASTGDHVLRLHFAPFSSANYDLFSAVFTVSALDRFELLKNFSVPRGGAASPVVKEFFLRVDSGKFVIAFTPSSAVAFVSAVEVFTAPEELLRSDARWGGLTAQLALETVHRINMGGPLITPSNDSLWRSWIPDGDFLLDSSTAGSVDSSVTINYASDGTGPTEEVAPSRVYSTAQAMNKTGLQDPWINITWRFNVSTGDIHLVRMHFCDIVTNHDFYRNLQLSHEVSDRSTAPYYSQSYVADGGGAEGSSRIMEVTVGRSDMSTATTADALLNGLEIMKVLNSSAIGSGGGGRSKKGTTSILIGSVVGGLTLLLLVVGFLVLSFRRGGRAGRCCRRKGRRRDVVVVAPAGALRRLPQQGQRGRHRHRVGMEATGDEPGPPHLLRRNPLGDEGLRRRAHHRLRGFGNVYKGVLRNGTNVAVKRGMPGSSQGYPEFQAEVLLLSKIRHRHLVSLVGYCEENSEMILVYEFMEKGTLKGVLYDGGAAGEPCLSWKQRLEICIGAARGIHYLHTGDSQLRLPRPGVLQDPAAHRQVRRLLLRRGASGGALCQASNRPAARRRPAQPRRVGGDEPPRGQLEQIVDPRLRGEINAASLRKFGETAMRCLEPFGDDRPAIGDVLWNLEYCLQLQQTEIKREAYEDSGVCETQFPAALPLRPVPSAGGTIGEEQEDDDAAPFAPVEGLDADQMDFTASKAFSQLITTRADN
ncbi:unnamed protein product [Spirodela intermedia]|uniref:Protein kinase domain-containing protein n=1 Tax=Spirodela intermedia TaxID=51605 RepID=A0A7I8J9Y0_SPIIN|nr:unnamed protein product [Spirodela intermedia]CAA6666957.1 unnamed protein product [Spirodela intermedia]